MAKEEPYNFTIKKRHIAYLLLCIIAFYVIAPKIDVLVQSLPLVRHADPTKVISAILATSASYLAAAGVYYYLALKPLRYGRTLFMQVAGMFANRILPAGIGGIGINYLYLRKAKHNILEATAVVAANNTVGLVGHLLLTFSLFVLFDVKLPTSHLFPAKNLVIVLVLAFLIGVVTLLVIPKLRKKLKAIIHSFIIQIRAYGKHPSKLFFALIFSLVLTFANVTCLWLSILALHINIGLVPVLIIFTFGLLVGTATPTPGSLGGIEAGLVAGLVSYDIPVASAVGAVLLYRLISYWMPLFVGSGAFIYAKRQNYF